MISRAAQRVLKLPQGPDDSQYVFRQNLILNVKQTS